MNLRSKAQNSLNLHTPLIASRRAAFLVIILLGIACLLSACGLSEEPSILRTAVLPTATPVDPKPEARPNVARGAAIFLSEQGCQTCHGKNGQGDGPVLASMTCGEIKPILANADSSRAKTPLAWFLITSNGNNNAACRMPPWARVLSTTQRWDVVAFAYSLHYAPDTLARGKIAYASQCASCHGETAAGNGLQAKASARPLPDLSNPAYFSEKSDAALWQRLTEGIPAMGPDAHRFKDTLSEADRWAVVAYMRSLSWDGLDQVEQVRLAGTTQPTQPTQPTPSAPTATPILPTVAPNTPLTVRGKLTMGTLGKKIPAGQTLTLRLIERTASGLRDAARFEATSAAEGGYEFANVPRRADLVYVVFTVFDGLPQFSEQVQIKPETPAVLDLPLQVFNVTQESSVIRTEVYQMLIDFPGGAVAQVRQALRLTNASDEIYIGPQKTQDGRPISVLIDLPPGAQRVQVSNDDPVQQYVMTTENGIPVAQGAFAVNPGEAVLFQVAYEMRIEGDLRLNLNNRYPVSQFAIALPSGAAKVADSRFSVGRSVTLQTGVYDEYTLDKTLVANDGLQFIVTTSAAVESASRLGLLALVVVSLATLGATVWAIRRLNLRDKAASAPRRETERLIRAIADLDAADLAGTLDAATYAEKRAVLKAKLAALLKDQEANPRP